MNRKIREAIRQHHMIQQGDRLAVGVSGGADSVALLHFLWTVAAEWQLSLVALHLNHNLRGAESERDEEFVRQLCARWGIDLRVHSADIGALSRAQGLSVEECARQERYAFFARHTGPGDKIATAHTLSDSAETVLLNLARGTALRGLCGIPPTRATKEGATIIRPLIGCSRAEVEGYCRDHALDYVIDSTNLSDAYSRNKLRHKVMPVLGELNPAYLERMAAAMNAIREDADYLDDQAAHALSNLARGGEGWDAPGLLALPRPLRMRALLSLLRQHSIQPEGRRLEQLEQLLTQGGGVQLSRSWVCRKAGSELRFSPAQPEVCPAVEPVSVVLPLTEEIVTDFVHKKVRLRDVVYEQFRNNGEKRENLLKNLLDCDRIGEIVKIRQRLPGDRIALAGRGCTKSLKKLFQEAGLPQAERSQTVVLEGEHGLLWVEGFGVAETAKAGEDTRRAVAVEVMEDVYRADKY